MYKQIASGILGAVAAVALFLSCSDNTVPSVDAQADCMCPDAEPPLEGRIVRLSDTAEIPAEAGAVQGATCPEGGTVLGGGCDNDGASTISVNRSAAAQNSEGWSCEWWNPFNEAATGTVTAICLVPPE